MSLWASWARDYAFLPSLDDAEIVAAFEGAGLSHSAGVGRISYVFGFEGPSVAVDTASSSSLVALYQAVRCLQEGNCNLALAGGVNAILAPVNSLLMSKAALLAPDGRCKSFSADADGFWSRRRLRSGGSQETQRCSARR